MNGPKGFITIPAMLLGILISLICMPAFAVDGDPYPPKLFELDGDPQDDTGAPLPDEWDTLYLLTPPYPGGMPIAFTGILADPAPASIFWKGGSKDIHDIPNWWHKDGSVPDKDDITNAYAAAYLVPEDVCLDVSGAPVLCTDGTADTGPVHYADDLIAYFGLDRYDNSGDAFAAFWFLQSAVTKNDSTSQFDGEHVKKRPDGSGGYDPGDLMVLVEYPQGSNAVPVIKVYEWDPDLLGDENLDEDGKSIGPLEMIYRSEDALCDGDGNKVACAITNIMDVPTPDWDYTPKGGSLGDDLPFETFYEGGINVTRLLGGASICISTFLAETRSSRSETAQLKDFVIGAFPVCSSEISTNVHNAAHEIITFTTVKAGTTVHDTATVTATGPGALPDPTGTVDFFLYDDGFCGEGDGSLIDSDLDVPLTGAGGGTATAESKDYDLTAGHTYSFIAAYNSNSPDFPDAIDEVCEVFTIEKWDSKISTQIHEDSGHSPDIQDTTVFVGLTIHDHAYVSELNDAGTAPTPTGTVTFNFYNNLTCAGTPASSTDVDLASGEATTSPLTPLGDTELSYLASYSGDANFNGSTDTDCESLDVDKYNSTIYTQIHENSGHGPDIQGIPQDIGVTVHDHAYVDEADGETNPPVPTGTVTFKIYGNGSCTGEALVSFAGIAWDQSDTLSGYGSPPPLADATTDPFTPPPSSFGIRASYGGDDNYRAATDSSCEPLTVNKLDPSILTKVIVRDRAEVSGSGSTPPSGDVKFYTYPSADCTGTPAVTTVTLTGGFALNSSEQVLAADPDAVSYIAEYLGDDTYNPVTHDCEQVVFDVLSE